MANTAGTARLIEALTGGSALEDAAYYKQGSRIMDAQNKQSMIDKRFVEANLLRDQMRSRGNFERNSMDMSPESRFAALAGMGSDFNQAQQGIGESQSNRAQAQAIQIALAHAEQTGTDPWDAINAIVAASGRGKLVGPTNVNPAGQAEADRGLAVAQAFSAATAGGENQAQTSKINEEIKLIAPQGLADLQNTQAGIGATNAQTQERQAGAALDRSKINVGPDGQPVRTSTLPADVVKDMLLGDTRQVPNPDYDDDAFYFTGPETIDEDYTQYGEFQKFQAQMGGNDPNSPYYTDERWAAIQFQKFQENPGTAVTEAFSGKDAQDQRNNRTVYKYDPSTGTVTLKQ